MTPERAPQLEIDPQKAFTEFVFKLSSRCNMQPPSAEAASLKQLPMLAQGVSVGCNQCYEYVDNEDWRDQPLFMSPEVIQQAAIRVAEHAEANGIEDVRVVGHGGEALLFSAEQLDDFATTVRQTVETDQRKVHFSIQTNGLLLTQKKLWVLEKHRFSVGLSLDGTKEANDRHRRDLLGRSTYDRVARAARMLAERPINWGFIMVIDTRNNPEETLEAAAAMKPHSIKLHPRHANWSSPPEEKPDGIPLGEWQTRVFERYRQWGLFHPNEPNAPFTMPLADSYIDSFLGAKPVDERVSNRYPQELFFLPNGDMQRLDTLKTTEAGAYKMQFNVFDHSLNEVARTDPGFIARRMGNAALASECLSCEFLEQCGGDYYTLRFKQTETSLDASSTAEDFAQAFRNPSIYCADQKVYLGHIASFVDNEKRRAATLPVDVYGTWNGWKEYLQKSRDFRYELGTVGLMKREESESTDVVALMGMLDNVAGLIRAPQLDPWIDPHKIFDARMEHMPPIPAHLETPLWDAIHNGTYSGLGALLGLEVLSCHNNPLEMIFFQPGAKNQTPEGHFRTVQDIHRGKKAAVMHSLFDSSQLILRDLEYKYGLAGGYWLVTKNAMDMRARFANLPSTSFVTPLLLPTMYSSLMHAGNLTFEDELFIAQKQPYTTPIAVTIRDISPNTLIVDVPGGSAGDAVAALDETAALLDKYGDLRRVQAHLKQEKLSISLHSLKASLG